MPRTLDVLLPLPVPPLRYLAPHAAAGRAEGAEPRPTGVGHRVVVPWQNGVRIGLVVGESEARASEGLELREAIAGLDERPHLHPALARDLPAAAEELAAPPGVVLAGLIATGFNDPLRHDVRAHEGSTSAVRTIEGLEALTEAWREAGTLPPAAVDLARRQGLLDERISVEPDTVRVVRFVRPEDDALQGDPREAQRRALAHLEGAGTVASAAELARQSDVPASAARALVTKGYAVYDDVPLAPPLVTSQGRGATAPDRLPESGPGRVITLYAGRRRDRLAAVVPRLVGELRAGRSPTVLVPEQTLLDETVGQLEAAVPGARLAPLSGDTSDAERRALWAHLASGDPCVVVGTYVALYGPARRPGLVVVLESGAGAYKLPSGARPYVPDLALRVARRLGVGAVMSDAGLPPEALRRSDPAERVALPHPRCRAHLSDLGSTSGWPLGADLVRVLRQVEARERQALVLAPRRGYSAALGCPQCGWVAGCPNCDLPLRYHREGVPLRCHQCGSRHPAPERCPSCGSTELAAQRGAGTEWVADAIREAVPDTKVFRFDADRRDDLGELDAGAPGIVVGTTALLRRRPLPNVSLVALSYADAFLNYGDFRADEEAARLLLQLPELWRPEVAVPLLVLQTFQPQASVFGLFGADDVGSAVEAHAADVLERRRRFGYPPERAMANIQILAASRSEAERAAEEIAARLRTAGASGSDLLGPAPATVARRRGRYAFHILVRHDDPAELKRWLDVVGRVRGAKARIDVAPRRIEGLLDLA